MRRHLDEHRSLKQAAQLTVVIAVAWAIAAVPAWLVGESTALIGLTIAAALCLLPGLITVVAVEWLSHANRQVAGVLLGSGLRLVVAVGGGLLVAWLRPDMRLAEFFVWLAAMYAVALVAETRMFVSGGSGSGTAGVLQA